MITAPEMKREKESKARKAKQGNKRAWRAAGERPEEEEGGERRRDNKIQHQEGYRLLEMCLL